MSDKSIEVDLTKITETKEHYLNVLSLLEELPSVAFDKSKLSKVDLILLQHVLTETINDFIFSHKQTFSEHDILTFLNPKVVDLIVKDSELTKVEQVTKSKEPVHKEHYQPSFKQTMREKNLDKLKKETKVSKTNEYWENQKKKELISPEYIKHNERLLKVLETNISLGCSQTTTEEAFSNVLEEPVRLNSATYSNFRDAYQYATDKNMTFRHVILNVKFNDYKGYRNKRDDTKYRKITMVD